MRLQCCILVALLSTTCQAADPPYWRGWVYSTTADWSFDSELTEHNWPG